MLWTPLISPHSSTQKRANGDDENVGECMIPRAVDTGIGRFFEVVDQSEVGLMRVWPPLHLGIYRNRTRPKCCTYRLFFFHVS